MNSNSKRKKLKTKSKKTSTPPTTATRKPQEKKKHFLAWLLAIIGITAICFFPMLKNNFTNWDDETYVVNNALLRGPDWKGIFTQPIASNYHPLTIISLVINYGLTGLSPSSYLIFNLLLHLVNTALVFYFVWTISDKKIWVAGLTAIIFGIHPMHVESVAWISERKDVLYTLFFLLSLLQYWRFLQTGKRLGLWLCFLFFILSLLSKPAAIILPLVLFLLDYWKGRPINLRSAIEKIPFFIIAAVLFFLINLLLVLQLVSIGYTIVSERYTYVPYIGLGFLFGMLLNKYISGIAKIPVRIFVGAALTIFGFLTFQRTMVWKNSDTLWTDVIKHYSNAAIPHTNRAYYFFMMADTMKSGETSSLFQKVIDDCNVALQNQPDFQKAYETRGLTFLRLNKDRSALADGDSLVKLAPDHEIGYSIRGTAFVRLNQFEKAMTDFNTCLKITPTDHAILNKRGAILYNQYQKYHEALADFTKAIEISPEGSYYLNRSRCYYLLGDTTKAKQDVQISLQKGVAVTAEYRKLLNL